ncbi:calcium-binding protein [Tropicimonas marinistellae]|uniref:calcium-binding protein n=1 Tax=Tropicimonas marinistellae TaxID=1739787 RepID=UPI00082A7778|nr:hypothetical protein [Tropicimonas marinistellae]
MFDVYLTDTVTSGNAISGDRSLYIAAGVTIASTAGDGISTWGGDHEIDIEGHVFGGVIGVHVDSYPGTDDIYVGRSGSILGGEYGLASLSHMLVVTNSGSISGHLGVYAYRGDIRISNTGVISGTGTSGITADFVTGRIANTGTITGGIGGYGIHLNRGVNPDPTGHGATPEIVNHGTILGTPYGVYCASDHDVTVRNYGTIDGVFLSGGDDHITNGGLITGTLDLSGGDDVYLGVGDGRVERRIEGGAGDDTLTGGDKRDVIFGDAGKDTLTGGDGRDRLQGGAGDDLVLVEADGVADRLGGGDGQDTLDFSAIGDDLKIDLRSGTVRSVATGRDEIEWFEFVEAGGGNDVLIASDTTVRMRGRAGDDILRGHDGADTLAGSAGDDLLVGNGGRDVLIGGWGDDTLAGKAGADLFIFADGFGRDVIRDFNARSDREKIDLQDVSAIRTFADLATNHMRQVGEDVRIAAAGEVIWLEGVDIADLQAVDFLF